MTKHAYLIIAHNEFEVLQRLISALDDERNDIYVHIDCKVRSLPILHTRYSRLTLLQNRVNTIWGDISQVTTEYALFEAAAAEGYQWYHLISGVHYPLQSQDAIHRFFEQCAADAIVMPLELVADEMKAKLGYRHFFLRHLISHNQVVNKLYHLLWRAVLKPQKILGVYRDVSDFQHKLSQWCSLNDAAVHELIANKPWVMRRLVHTFCCDEFFVAFALKDSTLKLKQSDLLLYQVFTPYTPKIFSIEDFDKLIQSGCLFARKLTTRDSSLLIDKIDSLILKERL